MTAHNRRLKQITFELGATEFECQVQTWKLMNNTKDGNLLYTFCPNGEFREETDADYVLELTFYSDWRAGGISDYLWENDGATVAFTLDHHPDITGEHVQWTGSVQLKAPTVGGKARETETTEVKLLCVGTPVYARIA